MLDKHLTDGHHEDEPTEPTELTELETLESLDRSLDRQCIRDCKRCISANFCSDYRDSE